MRPALAATAAAQDWMFTRAQALRAGYTEREIKALTRPDGQWATVRVGVYCVRSRVDGLGHRGRWLLKDMAAVISSRRPATMSHDSAARVLRIDTLDPPVPGSHLTLLGKHGSRTNSGLTRHRDALPLCVELVDGVVCTSYARTAIDVARWHGYLHGLVAVDSVRRIGVPVADLEAELERMTHHPRIATARAAVRDSTSGAESVLETLGRELVESLGIGDVDTQFAVRIADGRTVWLDIRVGCHFFECEGKVKLTPVDEGGVATTSPQDVAWKQQGRRVEVCAEGFGISQIRWTDCFGQARDRARVRLLREYAVSETRFGRAPTAEQLAFAAAHPRRRPSRLWVPGLDAAA
ncbi:hypothetical protein [Nocardioides hwasunensis]|uniref:Type IV toxin-antitoxin system AbiEi family antitoxin domain-containing protein n=1 Tax=Nocardioides hwasunensis TaxID=397258 RepID=A0ABR8MLI9_9ACTN|nr:hypothetical protein [Nocardioides hwasunensis]MBD3916880.1 hypothetical protein [Nocardioides hwasunensis]